MKDLFAFETIAEFFTPERLQLALKIGVALVLGVFISRLFAFLFSRIFKKRISVQASMITRKVVFYTGLFITLLIILRLLGLKLAALLGAAGVVGIAVGFAAQKSLSNLISGIFLFSEKPFAIGDVITVGGTTGIVMSIDLLSIKMRTFDNKYVRIPSEQILNSELTNITRFPIRRMDFNITVAVSTDIEKARSILMDIAETHPLCLIEPEPLFIVKDFTENGIPFLFGVWFESSDYLPVKNDIIIEIHKRFCEEGIEIPYPHTTLLNAPGSGPLSVRLEGEPPAADRQPEDTGAAGKKE
jgi:small-conductance mechanosensitive channel